MTIRRVKKTTVVEVEVLYKNCYPYDDSLLGLLVDLLYVQDGGRKGDNILRDEICGDDYETVTRAIEALDTLYERAETILALVSKNRTQLK